MGAAGILSSLGNMANEQRLHDRGRGELLSDQDRQMRAKQITDALEAGRTYGTLTPEQQSQAMDELHGLYNQPQHMPFLVDALKRVTGAVKGAYQGAVHPNAPAQNPSANVSSAAPSPIARPTFGGSPMLPKQDVSIPVTPQNPQMGMESASPAPPMQAAPAASAAPSVPPPRAPQSVGEIIASAYPRGGTFNAQMQKMITQYQLMNQGKLGVAQINAFGKKLPIAGDALPENAIGPDGQPIPAEMRTGPYIRQGYFEDPNTGEPIPTYVRQAVKQTTTSANGQRLALDPYTGTVKGSYGTVQAPTVSTRETLGKDNKGNTVAVPLTSTRTPISSGAGNVPSMPVAGQSQQPSVGSTLKRRSAPSRSSNAAPRSAGRVIPNFTPAANLGADDLETQAQMVADGRMAPAEIKGGRADAGRVLARAKQINPDLNVAQNDIDYSFMKNTGTQNTLSYLNSLTGVNGQSGNLDEIVRLSKGVGNGSFKPLNSLRNEVQSHLISDPKRAAFASAVVEVGDQIAKVLQGGGTGSGTSDAKLKQGLEMLNRNFSPAEFAAVASELKTLLSNRKMGLTQGRKVGSTLQSAPKPSGKSLDDEIMKAIGGK